VLELFRHHVSDSSDRPVGAWRDRGPFAAAEVGETFAQDRTAVGRSLGYRVVEPVGRYWPGG